MTATSDQLKVHDCMMMVNSLAIHVEVLAEVSVEGA